MTMPYSGPERRQPDPEVLELRGATQTLANQVENLQAALGDANKLHSRQLELEEEAARARAAAEEAKRRADELERVVVPREEHERNAERFEQQRLSRRRRILKQVLAALVVALVVAGAITGVAVYAMAKGRESDRTSKANNGLLDDLRKSAFQSCLNRNGQQDAQRQLWQAILHSEIVNSDPTVPPETRKERIAAYQLALRIVPQNYDCGVYLRYKPGHGVGN